MNVRLLRRVAKHILAEPKRFLMDNWMELGSPKTDTFYDSSAPLVGNQPFAKCGTAACIAGWTCLLADKNVVPDSFSDHAMRLLDINHQQADSLFGVASWPEKFDDAYSDAKTQRQKVKIAVARIEHFIKTKGKE